MTGAIDYIVKSAKNGSHHQSSSALEILKLRYAKGEISDSEYAARKEELMR
jgi:uncharacterized membrane protein